MVSSTLLELLKIKMTLTSSHTHASLVSPDIQYQGGVCCKTDVMHKSSKNMFSCTDRLCIYLQRKCPNCTGNCRKYIVTHFGSYCLIRQYKVNEGKQQCNLI